MTRAGTTILVLGTNKKTRTRVHQERMHEKNLYKIILDYTYYKSIVLY